MDTIRNLAIRFQLEMKQSGYSVATVQNYKQYMDCIIAQHDLEGKDQYDPDVVQEYLANKKAHYSSTTYENTVTIARRFTQFCVMERIEYDRPRYNRPELKHFKVVYGFVCSYDGWPPGSKYDIEGYARRHFLWLEEQGCKGVEYVCHKVLQEYFRSCAERVSGRSLKNMQGYLRRMYRVLFENGYTKDSFEYLLSLPIAVEKKVFHAFSHDEISVLIRSIDKTTSIGKRDYAILMLATVTGLRSCDIKRLSFGDIDWAKGELQIIQSKTAKPLALPLTADVGEAIENYILHGRPKSNSMCIFLSSQPPYREFQNSSAIRSVLGRCCKQTETNDRGFHAFRRSMGQRMVEAETPVTMVAQMLGHSNLQTVDRYISLDAKHLKLCALDFEGIPLSTKSHLEPRLLRLCALNLDGIAFKGVLAA